MKNKLLCALVVVMMVVTVFGASPVKAAAYGTSFTTSITYQNVGASTATVSLEFYAEANGTPIIISRPDLAPMAGTSIYVGALGQLGAGFKGSAVLISNQPLVATLVQSAPVTSPIKIRPLSNGFTGGSNYVLVPTALLNTFGSNTIISVQNVDSNSVDLQLRFVPLSGSDIIVEVENLPAFATKYFDIAQMAEFGDSFNGSVQIYATKSGSSDPGSIVASAMELNIEGDNASAYEGTNEFATTIYMPSAMCLYQNQQTSSYAVQNTTDHDITFSVSFRPSGVTAGPFTLTPGTKQSVNGCDGNTPGFIGSAVIEASGDIVAMGKVYGGGLYTAFLGFTNGSSKISLPYVRWTNSHWYDSVRQRAYIAIQNVGADLPAGAVTVNYYDKDGNLVGSDSLGAIASGAKVNSNPSVIGADGAEFGYYDDGTYGGSAVVEGPEGSELAVVVRISTYSNSLIASEDYTGIPIQ
ncbi:MAG TPA: hypothetical protein DCG78_00195 [Anaerolineaceae bacterium]|nr:hypothetical protein [Anaerolineaceae bacterium]